ncbi:MAG TPA: hypothetical protein VN238_04635 [Solirubrobacteraceae bacterium]|nr:hypothetical protein [Solirubrobacteraceae bacterium]
MASTERLVPLFMPVLRNIDLLLLALALPLFLVAGIDVLGWVAGAAVWAMWRLVGQWAERRAAAATTPKETAGFMAGSMVGRGWLLGLMLLAAGLAAGKDVGLSAAILALALFTVHLTSKLVLGSTDPQRPTTT